jgi:hypothetical protein
MNNDADPPSCLPPPIFMLGQDSRGSWVVEDKDGTRGGLFADRAQALRYIRSEIGNPRAFVSVAGVFELNMAPPPAAVPRFADSVAHERARALALCVERDLI